MGKFEEQLRFRVKQQYIQSWPNESPREVALGVDDQMEMMADRLYELLEGKLK